VETLLPIGCVGRGVWPDRGRITGVPLTNRAFIRPIVYLPLLAFPTFDDEADQYLCAAVLRPGNAATATGAHDVLKRVIVLLREAFPSVRLRVRLDGGFAQPTLLANLDLWRVEYVVAMAENAVLTRHAEPLMAGVRTTVAATAATAHVYGETHYAAGSWTQPRCIIIKAEVVHLDGREPRDNARFVITNLLRRPRSGSTSRCTADTADAGRSRTGSKNSITGWRSIARVAPASGRISSASCSPRRRTS
jgi:hypothetical protein